MPAYATSAWLRAWRHPDPEQPGRNHNVVYTQINEYTFLVRTLRPIRRGPQESQGTNQRQSLFTFTDLSAGLSCSQTSPQVLLTADGRATGLLPP